MLGSALPRGWLDRPRREGAGQGDLGGVQGAWTVLRAGCLAVARPAWGAAKAVAIPCWHGIKSAAIVLASGLRSIAAQIRDLAVAFAGLLTDAAGGAVRSLWRV